MTGRTAFRLTRILAMLPWVIANPGATVEEVCERFGYRDHEDLVRDLETVFVCGLPGYGPGDLMVALVEDGRVVVETADYFANAPRLSPAEALGMLVAGMTVIATGVGSPALQSAVAKLVAVIAPEAEEGLAVEVGAEPELVGRLREAAADGRVVEITYLSLGRGEQTTRMVEPWAVFTSMGNWYVVGHCRHADAPRNFRIDRIRSLTVTEEGFTPPPARPEPEIHYTPGDDDAVSIIDLRPQARWVLDYYPVEVLAESHDHTRIRFTAGDPEVAARLLLRLGGDARLVEGEEVRAARDRLGSAILRRYQ